MKVNLSPTVLGRLTRESFFWLATVRPEGTPHLAPLRYIWHDECLYVFAGEAKLNHVRPNPAVSVALQDGVRPVILEGEAVLVTDNAIFDEVAARYQARFTRNTSTKAGAMQLVEIVPHKVLHWNGEPRAEALPIPSQARSLLASASPALQRAVARLHREHIVWLATVRPEGRPHLVPIWHVWHQGKLYISTGQRSIKMHNIRHQPRVTMSLPDAIDVVLVEGVARPSPELEDELAPHFVQKFGWDFRGDAEYGGLAQITPARILAWQGDYQSEGDEPGSVRPGK